MTNEITAEMLEKVAAKLGAPPTQPAKRRKYPIDLEVEEIMIGDTKHCRVHVVHYLHSGRAMRGISSNHTAGPDLDALIAAAERMGFHIIRTVGKVVRR